MHIVLSAIFPIELYRLGRRIIGPGEPLRQGNDIDVLRRLKVGEVCLRRRASGPCRLRSSPHHLKQLRLLNRTIIYK